MKENSERRLAAVLAADVVGYSRLAGADEERTLARLRALRGDLIDPAVAAHRGRVVKRAGDGTIVEFRSVVNAVRCALEVQQGMVERNHGLAPERQILFRIGIHSGDVVGEADGDVMGDGVNIAARLEGMAEPGGIVLSEDAYRQVRDRLPAQFTDLGERELKNITRPIRVYALSPSPSHSSSPSPPLGERGRVRGDAPGQPTSPSHRSAMGPSLSPLKGGEGNTAPRLSIVVLPFANIGGDPEQEYFVDGVTESLTTDLSRISGSFVIARNTAFTYKGRPVDVKQIGRELNVRYVLEGSVQRGGSRLRVNVQLIDTESGAHLWAERFDKPVADLFDMQDEIVGRLARALQIELINAESQRGLRDRPHDGDATDLTMRGWAVINRQLTNENNIAGRDLFEQALALDPDHDDALAGLAYTLMREFRHGWNDSQGDHEAKTIRLADRAIALNPNNVLAYIAKGIFFVTVNRLAEALVTAETGLRYNPSAARLFFVRANAKQGLGRHEEAIADYRHAIELSPREPIIGAWYAQIGGNELSLGNYEAAIAEERRALDLGYRGYFAHAYLAAAHALLGNRVAAREALAEARNINPRLTMKWLVTHSPDTPNFFDGLRKAGMPEG